MVPMRFMPGQDRLRFDPPFKAQPASGRVDIAPAVMSLCSVVDGMTRRWRHFGGVHP